MKRKNRSSRKNARRQISLRNLKRNLAKPPQELSDKKRSKLTAEMYKLETRVNDGENARCPHGMFYSGAGACPQCGY